jgi:hypothetical protein
VKAAVDAMVAQRFMLREDADAAVARLLKNGQGKIPQ